MNLDSVYLKDFISEILDDLLGSKKEKKNRNPSYSLGFRTSLGFGWGLWGTFRSVGHDDGWEMVISRHSRIYITEKTREPVS